MTKRLTFVLPDDDLYLWLKAESIKRQRSSSSIMTEALIEWLENHDNPELLSAVKALRSRWKKKRRYLM